MLLGLHRTRSNTLLVFISATSFIFGLARLIRMYVKEKDPTMYWIWFGVALAALIASICLLIYWILIKKRKQESTN